MWLLVVKEPCCPHPKVSLSRPDSECSKQWQAGMYTGCKRGGTRPAEAAKPTVSLIEIPGPAMTFDPARCRRSKRDIK